MSKCYKVRPFFKIRDLPNLVNLKNDLNRYFEFKPGSFYKRVIQSLSEKCEKGIVLNKDYSNV